MLTQKPTTDPQNIRVPHVVVTLVPVAKTLESVILRPFMMNDASKLIELIRDQRTWLHTQDPEIKDEAHLVRIVHGMPDWVFTVLHPELGICGSFSLLKGSGQYSKRAELGGWLSALAKDNGLGTEIARQLIVFAAENGIVRVDARPAADNLQACRTCEAAGMKLEATMKDAVTRDNKMIDERVYSWLKKEGV